MRITGLLWEDTTSTEALEASMASPKRIQLSRAKGWRKPSSAVVVARPSRWGNPYRIERTMETEYLARGQWYVDDGVGLQFFPGRSDAAAWAVALYASDLRRSLGDVTVAEVRRELAGRDLACWCPLEDAQGNRVPCHADVLLEIANGGDR